MSLFNDEVPTIKQFPRGVWMAVSVETTSSNRARLTIVFSCSCDEK